MENKYKDGNTAFSKEDPSLKQIIRRYVDRIYYSTLAEDPSLDDSVYFESELIPFEGIQRAYSKN